MTKLISRLNSYLEDIALAAPLRVVEVQGVPLAGDEVRVRVINGGGPEVPLAPQIVQHQARLAVLLAHVEQIDVSGRRQVEKAAYRGRNTVYRFNYSDLVSIRIHFIRIRIQHFRLNTDADPDPHPIWIQGLDDQKSGKISS